MWYVVTFFYGQRRLTDDPRRYFEFSFAFDCRRGTQSKIEGADPILVVFHSSVSQSTVQLKEKATNRFQTPYCFHHETHLVLLWHYGPRRTHSAGICSSRGE
jgi:hypothetical protein